MELDTRTDIKFWGIPIYLVSCRFKYLTDDFLELLNSKGFCRVYYDPCTNHHWYVKKYWWPFAKVALWIRYSLYISILVFIWKRLHLIKPEEAVCFSWRKHFRPLAWIINFRREWL